jgi:mannosyltransferase
MAGLGLLGANRPALWTDELATWGMATSSMHEIQAIAKWVDVVITPYYVVMHGWVGLFGSSDLALRLPSMLAMAISAGLVGVLGGRLSTPRAGLLAGIVFAILPSSSRFAQEARPYALTVLFTLLATFFLVRALDRPGFWRFAAYAAAVAVLGLFHGVALLVLAAHGWSVLAFRREKIWRWSCAAAVGSVPGAVLIWLGQRQKGQIVWIPDVNAGVLGEFPKGLLGATAVASIVFVVALFSLPLRYPAALYTAWAVVPPLCLLIVAQVTPIWLPRYLLFTLPAWALLAGTALARVRMRWGIAAVTALALLGVTAQIAYRAPDGHLEATRNLADLISAQVQPGDGVVYGSNDVGGGWVGRDTVAHYLPADRRPRDVLAKQPQRTGDQLLAIECVDVAPCLGDTKRLWVIRLGQEKDPLRAIGDTKEKLLRAKFEVRSTWHLTGLTLGLLVRRAGVA